MSFSRSFLLSASLLAIAAPTLARADEPPADGDTIVVTANHFAQPEEEVGQAITVITRDEIEQRQTLAVSDLLATTPGVTVQSNGGFGGTTGLHIRGAESEQTLVLIDGVRINDPASPAGAFDFSNLLAGNIGRIEVLRGPNSVIWGSQAIGGVVDVQTIAPTDDLRVNANAEYGSHDSAQLVGNVSGRAGPVAGSFGAGYFRTDGISALDADLGSEEPDGYRNFNAHGTIKADVTDTLSLDLRGYYTDAKVGIDGYPAPLYSFADTPEQSKTEQFVGYAGVNLTLLDGRFHNRAGYSYTRVDRESLDPTLTPQTTSTALGRLDRFEYQGVLDVAQPLTLVFGAETEKSHLRTTSPSPFDPDPVPTLGATRRSSGYGQAVVRPFTGFTLTGGVRYDHQKSFGGETTFGANVAYTPNGGATVLRGTYAEGFKAPTLFQLQSEYGNTALQPERAKSFDAGIEQHLVGDSLVASATWFRRRTRNQIDFVSCQSLNVCDTRPSGTYDNVARARAEGVEVGLLMRPTEGFDIRANYTLTQTRNRSEDSPNYGNRLARRPEHAASLSADYRFPFGLSLGGTILMVGDSYDDAANTRPIDGYARADIRASIPLGQNLELYGRIENLFDEQYETVYQYGTLGRAAYGGVRLTW